MASGSLVGVAGFEPATLCSQSRYANRTALHPVIQGIFEFPVLLFVFRVSELPLNDSHSMVWINFQGFPLEVKPEWFELCFLKRSSIFFVLPT